MTGVDTNVLVYAVNAEDPVKGRVATDLLKRLADEDGVLLWQVVAEFGAVFHRKKHKSDILIDIPTVFAAWLDIFPLVLPSRDVALKAWALVEREQMSYWDAMLFTACAEAGVTRLYTEDLQSRPVIEGVQIINPFA